MIYLDSASADDAREACALGFVTGITTNPTLVAREKGEPLQVLSRLLEIFPGTIFFQPSSVAVAAAEDEALRAHELAPGRVIIKLPARTDFVALAARLTRRELPCAMTAVYAPAQAIAAAAAGCRWLIPYVDRARRLMPEGASVVSLLASLPPLRERPLILAASIKTTDQVVQAFRDGAAAVTTSLDVIQALPNHELSHQAIDEFARSTTRGAAGAIAG